MSKEEAGFGKFNKRTESQQLNSGHHIFFTHSLHKSYLLVGR